MTWIRLDVDFPDHELIGTLAEALRVDPDRAGMALIRLWCRMAEHAADGQLDRLSDTTLEEWAGWRGRRKAFAQVLRAQCQESDGKLRGWWRQEKLLEHQRKKRRRPGPSVRRQTRQKAGDESGTDPAPDHGRTRGGFVAGDVYDNGTTPSTTSARAREALPDDYRADFDRLTRTGANPESLAREVLTLCEGKSPTADGATPEDVGRGIRELLLNSERPAKLGRYVRTARDARLHPLPRGPGRAAAAARPEDEYEALARRYEAEEQRHA